MAKQTKAATAAVQAKIDEAKAVGAAAVAEVIEKAGEAGMIVLVRGPEDGRRRGGLAFGPVEVEVDLGQISKANFEAILADPYLKVRPKPADDAE